MEPTINFFAVINTLGALQCTLTAFALFSIRTGNRTANRFLGLNLIATAVIILVFVMYDTGFFLVVPRLHNILDPFVFLIGPFFFLYVKSLINPEFKLRKRGLFHFLLFALLFLLIFPTVFESVDVKLQAIKEEIEGTETTIADYIIKSIVNVQILSYFIVSFRLLSRTIKEKLPPSTQNIPVNIKWLRKLIIAIICICLLSAIFDYIPMSDENDYNNYITPFLLTLMVYSTGYVGIRQSEIFTTEKLLPREKKYEKSVLTDEMAEDILKKLQQLMENENVFTDSTISLPKLAGKLRISTHHLSQILNGRLNRSFFNYINEHRVEAAKQKLLEPESQKYTMLELAYDVGFNSLSAFNTAFKKHTGMSPTDYKKQNTD